MNKTIEDKIGSMIDVAERIRQLDFHFSVLIAYNEAKLNCERNKELLTDSNILHEMLRAATDGATKKINLEMTV
jgi:hypothetical protein